MPTASSVLREGTTDSSSATRGPLSLTGGCDLPTAAEIGALLLRLYFGFVICWAAGISKFPLDAWFADQVRDLGFPAPTFFAWMAAMSEVAGGVLLLLGLATRPAALLLAITLGVASFGHHKIPLLSIYTSQHITLQYFWVYLFFFFAGAGRLSLDGFLRRRHAIAAGLTVAIVGLLALACGARVGEPQQQASTIEEASTIALAGSFNDWSLSATPMDREGDTWTATIVTTEPGPIEFKFVAEENWQLAAGENDQSDARFPLTGTADPGAQAANVSAYLPTAGPYRVTLSTPDLSYRLEQVSETQPPNDGTASDQEPAVSVEE
ncbi:DoxX family membrane protein [Botrimarina hoheduenensis]|uniref:Putative oxidoreductase CatD n=1 Tax=Botrimarina hoheduenensis TaxID=2528000 RepID=A0A5C5W8G2_9BACT|nr:DoxX family membrane protein [Botrimarina hoheduenensis]TWT46747.1 putative oxidoreductase CatD [Botrimarina hoheduenensis]